MTTRLQPKSNTLREIFLKSGNYCAFPDCGNLMMNIDGVFIGQVCHIEAAEEGGERFNPNMTAEERRHFTNLMLMCYQHHQVTNDVKKFPVSKLKKIKADHEAKFTEPGKTIYQKLTDLTSKDIPTIPGNLERLDKSLNLKLSNNEIKEIFPALINYIENFNNVPHEIRYFLGKVALRREKMRNTQVVQRETILMSDIKDALGISNTKVKELTNKLEHYSLGFMQEMSGPNDTIVPGIQISDIKRDWDIWSWIAAFCVTEAIEIETFTQHLNFGQLSE